MFDSAQKRRKITPKNLRSASQNFARAIGNTTFHVEAHT